MFQHLSISQSGESDHLPVNEEAQDPGQSHGSIQQNNLGVNQADNKPVPSPESPKVSPTSRGQQPDSIDRNIQQSEQDSTKAEQDLRTSPESFGNSAVRESEIEDVPHRNVKDSQEQSTNAKSNMRPFSPDSTSGKKVAASSDKAEDEKSLSRERSSMDESSDVENKEQILPKAPVSEQPQQHKASSRTHSSAHSSEMKQEHNARPQSPQVPNQQQHVRPIRQARQTVDVQLDKQELPQVVSSPPTGNSQPVQQQRQQQQKQQHQYAQQPSQLTQQPRPSKKHDQASAIKEPSQHTIPKYKATSKTVVHEPTPKDGESVSSSTAKPLKPASESSQDQVTTEGNEEQRTALAGVIHQEVLETGDFNEQSPILKSREGETLSKVTKGDTAPRMPSDSDHLKGPEDDVKPLSPPPTTGTKVGKLNSYSTLKLYG